MLTEDITAEGAHSPTGYSHCTANIKSGLEPQQMLLYLVQLRLASGCKAFLT